MDFEAECVAGLERFVAEEMGIPLAGTAGTVPFSYDGPWTELLGLRSVVAVHADGIWVLTAHDGGAADLAPYGVIPVPIP